MPRPIRQVLTASVRSRWLGRGAWTVADQALFAGANFLVNVLLARWLSPEGYGAYTVAFTLFLLLGVLHAGALVEPMLVFGSGRFERRMERYLRILLTGHGRFSVVAGLALGACAGIAWWSGQPVLASALAAFAVGQGLILFQWMMRSACYLRTQPHVSATTGVVYAGVMIAGVAGLNAVDGLNEATGVGLMAIASGIAGLLIAWRLRIPLRREPDLELAAEVRVRHRSYGGWAVGTGMLEWFHGFLPFLLLPLVAGLAETGALRALFNLVLPILHLFKAMGQLLLPIFVRAREAGTHGRVALLVSVGVGVATAAFSGVLWVFGPWILNALYGGTYDEYAGLMWIVAVLPLALAGSNVAQTMLRSAERPEAVFAARAAASGVAATVGAGLVVVLGVAGALLSDLVSTVTETLGMIWKLRRPVRGLESVGAHPPESDRRHVLVVAFSCGPGKGSEPGQGWQTVHRLAATCDVTALVTTAYRPAIERELAERPVPGLRVVFVALPREPERFRSGRVDRTGLREQVHYHVWNLVAGRVAQRLHAERSFDLVHHVSFMRYWSPSAAAGVAALGVPFLWGPVGGGESAPEAFVRAMPLRSRLSTRLRNAVRSLSHTVPSVRRTARLASLGLATTDASARRMRRLGAPVVEVARAAVALDDADVARLGALAGPPEGALRFIALGRLLHWKGTALGIEAFARALHEARAFGDPSLDGATFEIVGDGPEGARLRDQARKLGVAESVVFHGALPRAEALDVLSRSHVLVHPSLHDSGGYAPLEGLAAGRPVVCLDLGGPGRMMTPDVGVSVRAETPAQAVADLAAAFRALAADPARRAAMGRAGRAHVSEHYTWSTLADHFRAEHDRVLGVEAAPLEAASTP